MNRATRVGLILLLIALAAGAGFLIGHHHTGDEKADRTDDAATTQESDDQAAPVYVMVAPVVQEAISQKIIAYGSVIAQPGDVRVLSVPFESRVGPVVVTPGQAVNSGTELLSIEASPATLLAFQDAKNAVAAAKNDLQQTQQRFSEKLGTNQELSLSQQNLQSAQLKLDSLTEQGVGTVQNLKAPSAGVVSKVDVQEGQIIPAGGPLIEIAAENRIQVKLGVNQEDVPVLKIGQPVELRPVEGTGQPIIGHIGLVGQRVDPVSRLVDVLVSLPSDAHLMLESFVAGTINRTMEKALVVPRSAIVAEEDDAYAIFVIKDNKAIKQDVRLGIENKEQSQIISNDIKPGDLAAISATYALDDGAEVQIIHPTTDSTANSIDKETSPDQTLPDETPKPEASP